MAKKTKATFTQRRGSRDKGAYNANHNTLEATRKGQSHIDEERMHLNKYIRFDRNGRPHMSQGGNGGFNATQHERERYEELYAEGLEARNQRYIASRHKERCRTISEVYQDLKTAPLESIWQVGNSHSNMSREEMRDALVAAWNLTYRELREKYGENMVPLDAALHMDEKVCHIHHMYARAAFYPVTGAFMGNGAEIFVTGFYKLLVMERLVLVQLTKNFVKFIGILFELVICDTAFNRKFGQRMNSVVTGADKGPLLCFTEEPVIYTTAHSPLTWLLWRLVFNHSALVPVWPLFLGGQHFGAWFLGQLGHISLLGLHFGIGSINGSHMLIGIFHELL